MKKVEALGFLPSLDCRFLSRSWSAIAAAESVATGGAWFGAAVGPK
jgi:hypothetical protein